MVSNLASAILSLHPEAVPFVDFRIEADVDGPVIAYWDAATLGPQPDDDTLAAAGLAAHRRVAAARIDNRTAALIAEGFAFDGHTFSLSYAAQMNWVALYTAKDMASYPVAVTRNDDVAYQLADQAALSTFCLTALAYVQALLSSGRDLKTAIYAASDSSAIDAITDPR